MKRFQNFIFNLSFNKKNIKTPIKILPHTNIKKLNNPLKKIFVGNADDFGNFELIDNNLVRLKGGLHWFVASLFLIADMAGGGIVALPTAIVFSTFEVGIFLMFLMGGMALVSAILLGKAWLILLRQHPMYRTHCRKPYAEMGFRALGVNIMRFVSVCVTITQFGASVVFLLLSAQNINNFLKTAIDVDIGDCLMIVVLGLLLLPVTHLKSPQEFWPIILLGMLSTLIAVILICIGAWNDRNCLIEEKLPKFQTANTFTYLGTILFSFGGHSAFPTIQVDMKKPSDFDKSSYFGFGFILIINMFVILFGGLIYGGSLGESIINSIQTVWIRQAINLMISAHCLLTVTLIINPLNQEVEERFNVAHSFGIGRILVRTILMTLIIFTAETLPSFGSIMDLLGGSVITLTSLVFPCLFYLFLKGNEIKLHELNNSLPIINSNDSDKLSLQSKLNKTKTFELITLVRKENNLVFFLITFICIFGTLSGAVATISAIKSFYTTTFVLPCYLNFFTNNLPVTHNNSLKIYKCCKHFYNISLNNNYC